MLLFFMGIREMAQWLKYEDLSLDSEHTCRKNNMVAETGNLIAGR